MSGAEWELSEDIFPGKAEKGCCLFLGGRLPLVRSSAGQAMGIQEHWLKAWHSDGRLKELQAHGRLLFFSAEKEAAGK